MSTISFIITTYNIDPYIEKCLKSVAAVARKGDEVIIVDDGSTDETCAMVKAFLDGGNFSDLVEVKPFFLGANTIGGVGIGGNIGLAEATRRTVFFVDGDDWIDADGFNEARAHWEKHPKDIMFTNYLEFDQKNHAYKSPADAKRWAPLFSLQGFEETQLKALGLIAVPWRKFYRRDFLEKHKIRYPEGDFFFEDNPFHWDVCLKAETIGFFDSVTCYHRVNRPGQTMASTGAELAAFFTHFCTIQDKLSSGQTVLHGALARWLLNNMTWHVGRLSEGAYYSYAQAASKALKRIDQTIWDQDLGATEHRNKIWPVANRLREGDIWGQIDDWKITDLRRRIDGMRGPLGEAKRDSARALELIRGQNAADTFEALKRS